MEETTPQRAARPGAKPAYHHGDLRNALVEAATGLAREGGPDAVVLRAAARRVGVSPTAAYRHFAGQNELLYAVKVRGQQALAACMTAEADAAAPAAGGAAEPEAAGDVHARRLVGLGRGYLTFALREPGLFRTAFCYQAEPTVGVTAEGVPQPEGEWEFRSMEMLVETLDGLAATGRMPAARRPGAEVAAWSLVHGLAVLLLDGPFSLLTEEQRDVAVDRALDTLLAGFTAP
ncbi:TetR/AcrR family transcriptional regulator [Streptomyces sp. JJ36]|uniref:TetR/AcrR family transcriptional regulator n=1 Tax=Streptomyces sp. JJ36 TaxID=2736645 RepID=UPI001F44025A|nr:TetR/AcrR family transcriptional regulator [Streptomyces sp. JJ36]MCF6525855.1 TetR/AcrR family transcriptional regulator [Streptomyces sp. JJ36]